MVVGDIVHVIHPTGGMSQAPLVVRSLPSDDDPFVRVDYLRDYDDINVRQRTGLGYDPSSLELVSPGAQAVEEMSKTKGVKWCAQCGVEGHNDDDPHFTGKFDKSDYEAFFLDVTSEIGTDESISAEDSAKIVKVYLATAREKMVFDGEAIWYVLYHHSGAGASDYDYARAKDAEQAKQKFLDTCVQPDMIEIRQIEQIGLI